MKPNSWYVDAENSAVEKVKELNRETWLERFVNRLAEMYPPNKEQLEVYLENKRNLSRKLS